MHGLILLAEAALATFADEHEAIRVFAENDKAATADAVRTTPPLTDR
jgi:hypothetical protein